MAQTSSAAVSSWKQAEQPLSRPAIISRVSPPSRDPFPTPKTQPALPILIAIGAVTIVAGASGTTHFTLANFSYPALTGGYTATFDSDFDLDVTQTGGSHPFAGASANPETFTVTVT
jgi:hypothetical protein